MTEKFLVEEMRGRTADRLNADSAKVIADEREAQRRADDESRKHIEEQAQLYIKELEEAAREASGEGKQDTRILRDNISREAHDGIAAALDMAGEYFETQGFETEREHRYNGHHVYASIDHDDFIIDSFVEGLKISW